MPELKTKKNDASVTEFLEAVENENWRRDSYGVLKIMEEITGEPAKMWGATIVGFGSYHFVYASGKEGDWMVTGFSPRKQAITLYIMAGFDRYDELMAQLGKFTTGKSCLYLKHLSDVDESVLRELITASCDHMKTLYPV